MLKVVLRPIVTFSGALVPTSAEYLALHHEARPAAYRWDGGTFHSRNAPIAAAGCQKRDMGRTWTSACCKS